MTYICHLYDLFVGIPGLGRPRECPRRLTFFVFSSARTPLKTSHEGVPTCPHFTFSLPRPLKQGHMSGKKRQHKHKLFGRTFLTLTPGCPGVKKFLPTTRAAGKRTFWCGRPRFSARTSMTRRVVKKLCTKEFALIFRPLNMGPGWGAGSFQADSVQSTVVKSGRDSAEHPVEIP